MKINIKSLGVLALASGILFSGCSSNDIFDSQENLQKTDAVTYPVTGTLYVSGSSRANSGSVIADVVTNGFEAYIYRVVNQKVVVLFNGHVNVVQNGSSYTFSILNSDGTALVWEKGDQLFMRAVYNPENSLYKGDPIFKFYDGNLKYNQSLSDVSITGAEDVLIAEDNKTFNEAAAPALSLVFDHITSQAAVTVEAPDGNYKYTVDLIWFNCKGPAKADVAYSFESASWGPASLDKEYMIYGAKSGFNTEGKPVLSGSSTPLVAPFVKDDVTAYSIDKNVFMIPGNVEGTNFSENASLTIWYQVYDKNVTDFENSTPLLQMTELTYKFDASAGENKLYKIKLPVLPVINGTISADGWGNAGGVTVENFN